ncbi:MAG: hypothetical protein K6F94_03580 [Bacteroidaceae bacterium]|nr:hypothetical protein [Bacteroidaceae bacterium]
MKTKYLILATMGLVTLASCTSDDLVIQAGPAEEITEEAPILFSSVGKGMTRSDFTGAEAAEKLGNHFVVFGYKGATTAGYSAANTVFDNYLVEYAPNTANTTASNSSNWEYSGVTPIKHATDNGITSQKIKYWDYSKAQYDFIAWSTGTKTAIYDNTATLADGQVYVSAITPQAATSPATGLGTAYTFTGKAADLSNCYIADMVTVKKTGSAGVGTVVGYGTNPVTLRFRQLGTKVRIGIYETIPGYSVKNVQFYSAAASNDASATAAKLFTTTDNDIYTEGTYTVTFPTVDAPTSEDNNQAHVAFAPKSGTTQTTIVDWGGLNYTIAEDGEKTAGKVFLGRSSSTASFAGTAANNYYEVFLPNETGTNLNLRVNYTLESTDGSGEVIDVKGATAQVPSIYTTWKPGFAYTYIFKISDKTNGYTGVYDPTKPDNTTVNSDPAGLYPITFDAVVENAEDNDATQETITLVSAPSITTYQKGSTVVNNDEYVGSTGPIFVTVNDGTAANTPDLANGALVALTSSNAALYTLSDATATEADVIDAVQVQDDDAAASTIKGRSGLVLTPATHELVKKVEYGVDGNAIDLTDGTKTKAMKFTGTSGTYAFVYTKTASTGTTYKYQALNWGSFASGQTKYRYDYKDATTSDAQEGVKYFKADGTTGVYTMQTPFIGQGVSNLYLDNTGTTIASGYAVTGTTYYYTTDNGQSYTAAANIAYADFASATDLYTYDSSTTTYTVKTDTAPVNGTAYYKRTGTGTTSDPYVYTYCVILPQQTTGWKEADTTKYVKVESTETAEVVGMTYFDKYAQNNGVYYTKVIKVQ